MTDLQFIGVALVGGFIPAFIWLTFWLTEDRCQPEPRLRIAFTFLAGMAAVGLSAFIELTLFDFAQQSTKLFAWASTEELLKLGAAALFGLLSVSYDEPLDAIIYMTTAALGFAAMENTLFIIGTLDHGGIASSVATTGVRFIGASLLHTLASATIGLAMAFSFYSPAFTRRMSLVAGVILAISLHTLFNFFILAGEGSGMIMLSVFLTVWAGIIALLFLMERIKHTKDYC